MKKKIVILGLFLTLATYGFSQFEVKVNPIGLLFGGLKVSGEMGITESMGAEISMGIANYSFFAHLIDKDLSLKGYGGNAYYKYYFSPDKGSDRFYVDVYGVYAGVKGSYDDEIVNPVDTSQVLLEEVSVTYSKSAIGFGLGYKSVSDSGLVFDIGGGLGKNITSRVNLSNGDGSHVPWPFDIDFRISVGYRF